MAFKDPAHCEEGRELRRLIHDLVDYDEEAVKPLLGKLAVPQQYRDLVGAPKSTRGEDGLTVRLPMRGVWHGIEVTSLVVHYWDGGDPPAFSIVMRAPKADVHRMVNELGFDLPPDGKRTIEDEDAYSTDLSLEGDGQETRLSCAVG